MLSVGCGTAAQNGFVADNNNCFPDYDALAQVSLLDPTDSILGASDGSQATAGQKIPLTASADMWGIQLRVAGDSSEIAAEFDVVQALVSGETAVNQAIILPDGSAGDIIASGSIVPNIISTTVDWVDFKLADFAGLVGGYDYWVLLYPTSGTLSWTTSTSTDGSFSTHDGSAWSTNTAKDAAYSLIKCQILVGQ